jgi:hypothetical protein
MLRILLFGACCSKTEIFEQLFQKQPGFGTSSALLLIFGSFGHFQNTERR